MFQSSTRFLEFATCAITVKQIPGIEVSILYEVPRVCNSISVVDSLVDQKFQSSTRFLEFATPDDRQRPKRGTDVSILYEVPRVCNYYLALGVIFLLPVSILYEVPRVCNLVR